MRVRPTVFDSASERDAFRLLEGRWLPRLHLYPQLPFAKILAPEPADRLRESERRFFFQTNVDYTFCEPGERPVLSVEFDGIGRGYSRDGEYVQERRTSDPNRKWKLDFKLRLAGEASYPLTVLSFPEVFDVLDEEGSLTVLDSLIGRFLARRDEDRRVGDILKAAFPDFDQLDEWERGEAVLDASMAAEIQAIHANDRLIQRIAEITEELDANGWRKEERAIYDPPLPEPGDQWPPTVERVQAMIDAIARAERIGGLVRLDTPAGLVSGEMWLRIVGGELGVNLASLATDMAEYLALRHARELLAAE